MHLVEVLIFLVGFVVSGEGGFCRGHMRLRDACGSKDCMNHTFYYRPLRRLLLVNSFNGLVSKSSCDFFFK